MASSNPAPTDTITSTSPAGAADTMMPVTITHLILIGAAIVLTIAMIWWGQRLWKRHQAGNDALSTRGDTVEVGAESVASAADPSGPAEPAIADMVQPPMEAPVAVEPPAPVPVAPAPPPLADTVPATPTVDATPVGDLTILKGLGPKAAALLAERGVGDVAALAALSEADAAALDAELGPFRGRMARDRWHEQARLLTAGDRAGYEAIFGRLG
jgi:predicted flap endonuclease-1-like 5' DNA nuclease